MVWPERDGWTMVTRGRKRAVQSMARPTPRYHRDIERRAQAERVLSYAEMVKYGGRRSTAPTHYRDFDRRPDRPQSFEPRARSRPCTSGPQYMVRSHPKNKKSHHRQNQKPKRSTDPHIDSVRTSFKIIKLKHHMNNICQGQPPAIGEIVKYLSEVIKPALPNAATQALIEDNAKKWAQNTIDILNSHYTKALSEEGNKLERIGCDGFDRSFDKATQWAERTFGTKLKRQTVDEAKEYAEMTVAPLNLETLFESSEAEQESETSAPQRKQTRSTMTDPQSDVSSVDHEDAGSLPDISLNCPASPRVRHAPSVRPNSCTRQENHPIPIRDRERASSDARRGIRVTPLQPDRLNKDSIPPGGTRKKTHGMLTRHDPKNILTESEGTGEKNKREKEWWEWTG